MDIVECRFLIPICRDTDRIPHQPFAWNQLLNAIRKIFPQGHSGPQTYFHISSDLVPGEYDNPPTLDESLSFTIAITESRVEDLRMLLSAAANTFDQRAIYLSVAGNVDFIQGDPDGRNLLEYSI